MLLRELDDDSLLCIIHQVLRVSRFEDKIKLTHVNKRWRHLVRYAIAKEQSKLGLKYSHRPTCPDRNHTISSTDVISVFFNHNVTIDSKVYYKIQAWKLSNILMFSPRLQILSLSRSLFTFKILNCIQPISSSLCHLDLSDCRGLTLKYLPPSVFFANLRHLNLRSTDITDSLAQQFIASAPQLTALSVSGDNLTGEFISSLPDSLKTFSFGGRNVNERAALALENLSNDVYKHLQELKIIDLDNESLDTITKARILRCVELFPNLKSLVFKNSSLNSLNFPLLEIRKLHKLEVLRIDTNVTEDIIFDDMAILNMIEDMTDLVYLQLDLVAWNLYTDPKYVFEALGKTCPKLKYLSIRKWISLKAQSLMYLSYLKSLVYLDIGQVSCFNKINLHAEVIELMSELAKSPLRVLRLKTHFPDNDRFHAVIVMANALTQSRPANSLFRLDLPLQSKDYEPIHASLSSNNLVIANYERYYGSVYSYLAEFPIK